MKLVDSFLGEYVTGFNSGYNKSNNSKLSIKLALKIIDGNAIAKNQFVLINYNWLLFIVRRKFSKSNNHEDIVQDTFMIVINKLQQGKINQPKTILSYLRTTAINVGFSYLRQDTKFTSSIDNELLEEIEHVKDDILTTIIWNDKSNYVKQVISELKIQRDQDILHKFYYQEVDKKTICQQLELSSEHFDRVLYRAKQRLKHLIDRKGNNKPNNDLKLLVSKEDSKKEKTSNIILKIGNKIKSTTRLIINIVLLHKPQGI